MMRRFILFFAIFSLALGSCSKKAGRDSMRDEATLKEESERKIRSTDWVEPLESGILNRTISRFSGVSQNVRLQPQSLSAMARLGDKIYPSYADFGSLDVSAIPSPLLSTAERFSSALLSGTAADQFMKKERLFELALLYEDFGKSNLARFDSFLIGAPFVANDEYEIPIRLFSNDGSRLDLNVFFARAGDSWKIDQIQLQ